MNLTDTVVYTIIVGNVFFSISGFSNPQIFDRYCFHVEPILKRGEYHRFFTSMFLHVSWGHLLFNMFTFYSFGLVLGRAGGLILLLAGYLLSGVGGDLLALFINRKRPDYRAVGASGAISGIIYIMIFFHPQGTIYVFFFPVQSWLYGILFIIISIFAMGSGHGHIGHEAHLGGAITGVVVVALVYPFLVFGQPLLLAGMLTPVIILILVATFRPNWLRR